MPSSSTSEFKVALLEVDSFRWDEAKRSINIDKHGLDFSRVPLLLRRPLIIKRSDRFGEARWLAVGTVGSDVLAAAFVLDGRMCRVISL